MKKELSSVVAFEIEGKDLKDVFRKSLGNVMGKARADKFIEENYSKIIDNFYKGSKRIGGAYFVDLGDFCVEYYRETHRYDEGTYCISISLEIDKYAAITFTFEKVTIIKKEDDKDE